MDLSNLNLTEVFLKVAFLGAEWVLWLLVALSVLSVAIMIERLIYFGARRVNVDALSAELARLLRAGDLQQAHELVKGSKAIECIVVARGLQAAHRGAQAASEAMQSAKARERLRMESLLSVLATLGNNAPFIGLLGTVLGIIKASHDLSAAQAARQTAATAVMGGVFEALVATAVGLVVAIPAVVAYNFFLRRVRIRSAQADSLAHLVLSMFKAGATGAPGAATTTTAAASSPPKSPEAAGGVAWPS
ncbi:MAG: MotA/TolQ/ExbB proton channel family protein [Planctomycetia bacterium]|nr:MotA/TolQ/ExbB proton channel family protein [Planctomycetia bacterium]